MSVLVRHMSRATLQRPEWIWVQIPRDIFPFCFLYFYVSIRYSRMFCSCMLALYLAKDLLHDVILSWHLHILCAIRIICVHRGREKHIQMQRNEAGASGAYKYRYNESSESSEVSSLLSCSSSPSFGPSCVTIRPTRIFFSTFRVTISS